MIEVFPLESTMKPPTIFAAVAVFVALTNSVTLSAGVQASAHATTKAKPARAAARATTRTAVSAGSAVAGGSAVAKSAAASTARTSAGAKDLFYAQLNEPDKVLNNGIQCWIELRRAGRSSRVSNKFEFHSGDEIRFHVRANTDAFAYIVLTEGSRGERDTLFPAKGHDDHNRLKANSEYAIPGDGFMVFDSNPGTEKITVLLARTAVEPNQYLHDDFKDKVVIASAKDGSKDLVPGSFVVSMANEGTKPSANADGGVQIAMVKNVASTVQNASATKIAVEEPSGTEASTITVVQRDPGEVLALDIMLSHKP